MCVLVPLRAGEIYNGKTGDLSGIRVLRSAIVNTDDLDGENTMTAAGFSVCEGAKHLPSILARSEDRKSFLRSRNLNLARTWLKVETTHFSGSHADIL